MPRMTGAITVTRDRRERQDAFNQAHGIVPRTIRKDIRDLLEISRPASEEDRRAPKDLSAEERAAHVKQLEEAMREAAARLEFELAAALRDQIIELQGKI